MLRWKRVEISAGALLLGAALYYLDEQGVLLMAFCACALHELGHWLVIRALGGRVTALRITCVGAEMRLSARCPLGYWQQIAAALAGPAVNLLAARMAAGLGTEGAYCFAGLNLALAAFKELHSAGLRIPQDVSLVGFGGYDVSEVLTPALTTVRFDYELEGRTAAELILELIAGNPVESVKIGYTLIEGESVIDR